MKHLIRSVSLAAGWVSTQCGAALACPACAQALDQANSPGVGSMTAAYETSILFMLSMPFVLLAVFSVAFYRLYRKGLAASLPSPETAANRAVSGAETAPALAAGLN